MIFVSIISTVHVSACIGHLQVLTELYLFMLTLKSMAVGHFSYQPTAIAFNMLA
jgi:hypothetical protein